METLTQTNVAIAQMDALTKAEITVDALQKLRDIAKEVVITDETLAEDVTSVIKTVKTLARDLEAKRKEEVAPHYRKQQDINASYKRFSVLTDEIESTLKRRLQTYRQIEEQRRRAEEEARRKAEQERILAEAEKAQDEETASAILDIASQNSEIKEEKAAPIIGSNGGSASTRKVTKWKVTDFSKVPDKYKIIDEKMLNYVARDKHGERNIPGIEFYEEDTVVIR